MYYDRRFLHKLLNLFITKSKKNFDVNHCSINSRTSIISSHGTSVIMNDGFCTQNVICGKVPMLWYILCYIMQ